MEKTVFTMKLDQALRDEFVHAATAADRTASQLMRDLMRSYLDQQKKKSEYEEYYRQRVEAGRNSLRAGLGTPNDEVEARFSAMRKQVSATAQ